MAVLKAMSNDVSMTIQTKADRATSPYIRIKNGTKKGYLEAEENDCIDLTAATLKNHRGVVQKGKSQTIVCADGGGEE